MLSERNLRKMRMMENAMIELRRWTRRSIFELVDASEPKQLPI
jgi:hypothetical protein